MNNLCFLKPQSPGWWWVGEEKRERERHKLLITVIVVEETPYNVWESQEHLT